MAIKVVLILLFAAIIIGGIVLSIIGGVNIYSLYNDGYRDQVEESKQKKNRATRKIILGVVLALSGIICEILVPGNVHQVNTGDVAVVRNMGKIDGYREPGIYWDFYMTKSYEIYDTKIQTIELDTQTYSKDNQIIDVTTTFQYTIQSDMIEYIATNIGSQSALEDRLKPIILDSTKTVFAKNTAETMISNRAELTADINNAVTNSINIMTPFEQVNGNNIYHPMVIINNVLITNLDFTDDFEAAVAAKVAQEQKKQQALIEQEQKLAEAENNKKIAIAEAQASAESARLAAEAQAEVAKIKAQAEQEVAKIAADTAEYAGRKDAAVAMNKLAGINGWYVINVNDTNGNVIGYKLMKSDGTLVTESELEAGVKNLLEFYKYDKWDGALPQYQMGSNGTIAVVTP